MANSNKTQHNTKRVDIAVESTSLDENRVQRGVKRVIRVDSGIISQSNADNAGEIIRTK